MDGRGGTVCARRRMVGRDTLLLLLERGCCGGIAGERELVVNIINLRSVHPSASPSLNNISTANGEGLTGSKIIFGS